MRIIVNLNNKIRYFFYFISIALAAILLNLFYLQIYLNEKMYKASEKNYTRIHKLSAPRGNIVDNENHLLVTNRPLTNLYWQGLGNRKLTDDQINILHSIEKILDKQLFDEEKLLKIQFAEKYSKRFLLFSDLTLEQLGKVSEQFPNENNIFLETKFQRYYPHGALACHLLGYLGQIDEESIGKMGLEKIFEDKLKGESGTEVTTINSFGKNLGSSQIKRFTPGKTLRTTLNLHMQKIAEEAFPQNYKGTFIIMDPEDGSIRVLLSRPSFDPTTFLKPLNSQEWNEIQEQQPFLNRAFNAHYPPASVFKLISVSTALELGLINRESQWFCSGYINFGDRIWRCAPKKNGHGAMTTIQAVAQSCNTFFFYIAKRIHIDNLSEYAKKFGLGQKTGIIFSEKSGVVPSTSWKLKNFGESWWPGETLNAVIGQGYLLVTPIQITRMVAGISTGYLVTPRFLEEEIVIKKQIELKKETFEFLRQSMKKVVTEGTCRRIGVIKDINAYAKTGTAQTCILEKEEEGKNQYLSHAWFVSNFCYKNEKPLTMVIFLEHAGSSSVAITAAREFMIKYREMKKQIESGQTI